MSNATEPRTLTEDEVIVVAGAVAFVERMMIDHPSIDLDHVVADRWKRSEILDLLRSAVSKMFVETGDEEDDRG